MSLLKALALGLFVVICACGYGCVAPKPTGGNLVQTSLTIDREALAIIKQPGPHTLSGQAFMRTRGGDVRTCAGAEVVIIPVTPYTEERMQLLYGSSIKGFHSVMVSQVQLLNDPADYPQYRRTSICDASGNFLFPNLVAGEYFVITSVVWQTALPSREGGSLMQRIVVGSSSERVIVTQ